MSLRGLHKSSGYWNTIEARKDWFRLRANALELGVPEAEVDECAPPAKAGWRTIDKHIALLREKMRGYQTGLQAQRTVVELLAYLRQKAEDGELLADLRQGMEDSELVDAYLPGHWQPDRSRQ